MGSEMCIRDRGKGVMSENDLLEIHQKMIAEIENHGARIDGIYYCTALSEKDIRRKPGCGMFLDILHDFPDIERERCLMIGDSESDVMFAMNSGIRGVKV